ncbi:type II toxin-antitoxin system ParD family antitoxin [Rhizobium deserti]|uniref:Type II toxin-antitoxin system ParD family antitoxin n=1 Tax=Rhizobium deserti TaxID=2547961 RepID=A0A4R5UI63_9HYPH|nr:type II toxin-antitoxin system ParD family antitoxin [Rhizobium deserti]TDK35664.1 type II toxin-antitoxin system ParD family antitoxin [Rhizobium deserti]
MSVKSSVSISKQQDAFARKLVEEGRYSSLSAVIQRGLELLREETELKDAELAALKALLDRRAGGKFVTMEESHKRVEAMIKAKRKAYGL